MSACAAFRARLERELSGQVRPEEMRALAWHEHLVGCGPCRELLEAEQALEEVLASLPVPQLAPDLARRVLARLRAVLRAEDAALDALLELDVAHAPSGLVRDVLAGLRAEREAAPERALDRLLERYAVVPPPELARAVLAGLSEQRALPSARPERVRPRRTASWALPLAASLLAGFAGYALWPSAPAAPDELARLDVPPPELLEALDVLEEWELLMEMEQDLDLLFSTFGAADELLLDYHDADASLDELEPAGSPTRPTPRAPSRG